MKKVFYYGEWREVQPSPSQIEFPVSDVQPDDAYTIREIYQCWRTGQPTSVHPFDVTFDEEGRDFDDSDSHDDFRENPIDQSQAYNEISDAGREYMEEKRVVDMEKARRERAKKKVETSKEVKQESS